MPRKAGSKNKIKYFDIPDCWEGQYDQERREVEAAMSALEEKIGANGMVVNYGTLRGMRKLQSMINYIIADGDVFTIERSYSEFKNTGHYNRYFSSIEWAKLSKIKHSSYHILTFKVSIFTLDHESDEQLACNNYYFCVQIETIKDVFESMASRMGACIWQVMKSDYKKVAVENNFGKEVLKNL